MWRKAGAPKGPLPVGSPRSFTLSQGDIASHMEMHLSVGNIETVMTTDSKYLGACPVGMKPGDVVMADGKKMSVGN